MKSTEEWNRLTFSYSRTPLRFVAHYANGRWDEGGLTEKSEVVINESAGVLQYAQTCFEGLKAYTAKDGRIVCFRPDLNARRLADSARALEIPVFPEDKFLEAVKKVVAANREFVPPYGSEASLYLRPTLFATGPVLGVKPAAEYEFRIFCSPVGAYFQNGIHPLTLKVADSDRAAPHGTGHVKAGLNYAMSMRAGVQAHAAGFDENLYLDSATRTFVEETGGANVIFITKDGKFVTPRSSTILPSITRRSLEYVAEHLLGMSVEERPVRLSEAADFAECGLCGTAAVISPVLKINDHGKEIVFPDGETSPVLMKLRETLTGIQRGETEAPEGWIFPVE